MKNNKKRIAYLIEQYSKFQNHASNTDKETLNNISHNMHSIKYVANIDNGLNIESLSVKEQIANEEKDKRNNKDTDDKH